MRKISALAKQYRKWIVLMALALVMFGGAQVLIEGDGNSPFSYATFR